MTENFLASMLGTKTVFIGRAGTEDVSLPIETVEVANTLTNDEESLTTLDVHRYEPNIDSNWLSAKYGPSYLQRKRTATKSFRRTIHPVEAWF